MTVDLRCTYPTHAQHSDQPGWNDGVLGTADRQVAGMICPGCATYDTANPPAMIANQQTLQQRAQAALTTNSSFQTQAAAVTFPLSNAAQQALVNEVIALSRQNNALIRLLLGLLDSTTGT